MKKSKRELVTECVRNLTAYTPGEQPKAKDVVKLNTNENPYPPSPKCAEALKSFDIDRLRRYPDPECTELRDEIARQNATTRDHVFVGNGSDEVLALCAKAFVENDEAIGSLDPSYSLYQTLAAIRNVKWVGFDAKGPLKVRRGSCALFLLTNPNAPTGVLKSVEEIADFAKGFDGVVLVDEAYADFARRNAMALATGEGNRNVLVMRTFSKSYALAGMRVGYCVGPRALIDALYKIKDSYNVDAVAQSVALAALKDRRYFKSTVAKVVRTRKSFSKALAARGWDVPESDSNFVFARPPRINAAEIFAALRERNIFVRYFPGAKTGDRLRITIGTDEQMQKLLSALDELQPTP